MRKERNFFQNETFYGSLSQARQRAAELEVAKRRYGPKQAAKTVGEYLLVWLEKIKGTVSERSHETYSWHVKKLLPVVGGLPLYDLTGFDLQEGLGKLTGSPKTVKDIYNTLKTAFRQAVAWGLLGVSPAEGLRSPKVTRGEKRVLTPEELNKLLEVVQPYKHYLIIRLLALTGARLGEVLGLTWNDVNFAEGTLTIKRAVSIRKRKLKDTKTTSSKRTLKLDPETLNLLAALRNRQEKGNVASLRRGETLIFNSPDGRPVKDSSVRKTLNLALKKAGLAHIRIHDLRHTAGSLLLDAGYSFPVAAAFLGRSSPATTAAVYAHAVRKGASVAEVLDLQSGKKSGKD